MENRVLTGLVGLAEFFATNAGLTKWTFDTQTQQLFIPDDLLSQVQTKFALEDEDALLQLLNTLKNEYEVAVDMSSVR